MKITNKSIDVAEKKFIAVVHNWFIHSDGWHIQELNAKNEQDAETEAVNLCQKYNQKFSHAGVKVIELQTGEHLPRKLTLKERILGRILY